MTIFAQLPQAAGWSALAGASSEYSGSEICHIIAGNDAIVIESAVAGNRGESAFGIRYQLVLNPDWSARSLDVDSIDGRSIRLRHEDARWFDGDGVLLPDLDGCRWLDISVTPFTNTLPVRGGDWAGRDWDSAGDGHSPTLSGDFVYVDIPAFTVSPVRQSYTRIAPRTYRYVQDDFTADMVVDEAGLVTDYPGLFRRIV